MFQLSLPEVLFPMTTPKVLSNEAFEAFCFANPELIIEREANGNLTIMSPGSPVSGERESLIIADLTIYARLNGGKTFNSSTGFELPDTSVKSPDACYVSAEKLAMVTKEELRHFAKNCS